MRRITGLYEGVEYILLAYESGMLECPTPLVLLLADPDGAMPIGEQLVEKCLQFFGTTCQAREV